MATSDSTTKRCTQCGNEHPATREYFYGNKHAPSGLTAACKRCTLVEQKQYRERNSEQIKERGVEYRKNNQEKITQRTRQYYQRNRGKRLLQSKQWQEANPDKVREIKRRSSEKHREERNAKLRDRWRNDPEFRAKHYAHTENWRKRNPDKHKAYIRKYRQTERFVIVNRALTMQRQKREAGGPGYSADDVELQGKGQKWLCWWCGKPLNGSYHIDHRIPLKRGGKHDPGNIVLAHPRCNLQKKDKMPWEYNGRLL